MPEAYMTIDDSPSPRTGQLLDYLAKNNIQALFFCRGEYMQIWPDQVQDIIKAGHILANHSYAHEPAGTQSFEEWRDDLEKCETLIDKAYEAAGDTKPGKFFRFPYIDRGAGEKVEQIFRALIEKVENGERVEFSEHPEVLRRQEYLKERGYVQPFEDVSHPIYQIKEIREAYDCPVTFTSYDWMLSPRHKGKQLYKTLSDLTKFMNDTTHLWGDKDVNIVLFHDDREGVIEETCALIDHMIMRGMKFKRYDV